jgi:hypothetical protein
MQTRCYRCGWSYAIGKDEVKQALTMLNERGKSHYDSPCPRCRHANRISREQLERAAGPQGGPAPAG